MSNARQEYYQANKGRENASAKAYHAKNRDSRLVLIRKYRRANPEVFVVKHSEYRARTRGHAPIAMTAARLRTWLLRQGDRCKLCDRPGRNPLRVGVGKVLQVDHDLATGKVRGLLCSGCNIHIGHVDRYLADGAKALAYVKGRL